eukprot:6999679-Prymnesium_polylepis.1
MSHVAHTAVDAIVFAACVRRCCARPGVTVLGARDLCVDFAASHGLWATGGAPGAVRHGRDRAARRVSRDADR